MTHCHLRMSHLVDFTAMFDDTAEIGAKKDFQHHVIHQPSVVQLCFVGWRLYLHLYQLYYFSIPMIHPDNPRIGSRENWQVSRGGKKKPLVWFNHQL